MSSDNEILIAVSAAMLYRRAAILRESGPANGDAAALGANGVGAR